MLALDANALAAGGVGIVEASRIESNSGQRLNYRPMIVERAMKSSERSVLERERDAGPDGHLEGRPSQNVVTRTLVVLAAWDGGGLGLWWLRPHPFVTGPAGAILGVAALV